MTVDDAPSSDAINTDGAVEIEKQDYPVGQTTEFWDYWHVDVEPLDPIFALGVDVPSLSSNWARRQVFDGHVYKQLLYKNVNTTIKSFIDDVMIGFATFYAFLMPYHALKKG